MLVFRENINQLMAYLMCCKNFIHFTTELCIVENFDSKWTGSTKNKKKKTRICSKWNEFVRKCVCVCFFLFFRPCLMCRRVSSKLVNYIESWRKVFAIDFDQINCTTAALIQKNCQSEQSFLIKSAWTMWHLHRLVNFIYRCNRTIYLFTLDCPFHCRWHCHSSFYWKYQ